jgi:hypothetical protein
MIGDAEESFEAVALYHELALREKLLGKAVEENLFDMFAGPAQTSKFGCREVA